MYTLSILYLHIICALSTHYRQTQDALRHVNHKQCDVVTHNAKHTNAHHIKHAQYFAPAADVSGMSKNGKLGEPEKESPVMLSHNVLEK